jgi:PAS domain S-box-containing protein
MSSRSPRLDSRAARHVPETSGLRSRPPWDPSAKPGTGAALTGSVAQGAVDATELAARLSLTDRFADLGSWTWDPASDELTASDRFTALVGLPAGEPMPMSAAMDVMPPEDAEKVLRSLEEMVHDGRDSCSVDYRVCGPGEEVHWLEGYCLSVRGQGGTVEKVIGLSRDVTARVEATQEAVRAQRDLESARDYLRAVTDTMDEAMFTLDTVGYVQYMNPSAELLLGWTAQELDGKLMHDVAHNERLDGSPYPIEECPIMIARAEGRVAEVPEDVFICKDGTRLPVSYTALPFSTDAGIEGCVVIFEDITERKAEERRVAGDREKLAWATRIHEALEQDRFELYAQPIVDCASGRVVQQELLLRLNDPERGVVSPCEFLPVAEELGLIREIDRWVVARAARLAHDLGPVEVNLSARSIGDPHLIDHIERSIARAGAEADTLVFEITETALIEDKESARIFLERLHRLGCKIALDDFGTGYGGFSYLKQLPIDILKIDAEFVADVRSDPASRSVVEAVVSLARGFGLKTVGEGVEDGETFELLQRLGVDQAQGFHLGRPAPLIASSPAAPHRRRGREIADLHGPERR